MSRLRSTTNPQRLASPLLDFTKFQFFGLYLDVAERQCGALPENPRASNLAALAALRTMGKREAAVHRVELKAPRSSRTPTVGYAQRRRKPPRNGEGGMD
jgi:hypothetical protein